LRPAKKKGAVSSFVKGVDLITRNAVFKKLKLHQKPFGGRVPLLWTRCGAYSCYSAPLNPLAGLKVWATRKRKKRRTKRKERREAKEREKKQNIAKEKEDERIEKKVEKKSGNVGTREIKLEPDFDSRFTGIDAPCST